MILKEVKINNFRSIKNTTRGNVTYVAISDITAFVGKNNSGKSNILKALNLFFNNTISYRDVLDFNRDFTYQNRYKKKLAKEIKIELEIEPPYEEENLSKLGNVIWTKVWNESGLVQENITYKNTGETMTPDNRLRYYKFLKQIKYRYVPAVKSDNYFNELMGELYVVLSKINKDIFDEEMFTSSLQKNTMELSSSIKNNLSIQSLLSYSSSFKAVFSNLKFRDELTNVSLDEMGDGIKARYIPIILKYLADQEHSKILNTSNPRVYTIWGFEEPENNLEICSASELADYFLGEVIESKHIQLLLTTHSPIFYSLSRRNENRVITYFISQDEEKNTLIERINPKSSNLDTRMDLDYLVKMSTVWEQTLRDKLELEDVISKQKSKLERITRPVCFVEGITDKFILEHVIKKHDAKLLDMISIETKANGSGAEWVKRRVIGWIFNEKKEKCFGIFDGDDEGKKHYSSLVNDELTKSRYQDYKSKKLLQVVKLDSYKHNLLRNNMVPVTTLEEFYGVKSWKYAEDNGWLLEKSDLWKSRMPTTESISYIDFIKEEIKKLELNEDVFYYHLYKVNGDYKEDLAKYAISSDDDLVENLKPLVLEMIKFFK